MNILALNWRDIQHPEAGGAEIYVHNICSEFVKMGHQVSLYSSSFPGAKHNETIDGIKITRCGGRFSVYWSVYRQYLKEGAKYDVLFESINTIPFFSRLYAVQPVVPLIYSINNGRALIKELGVSAISLVGLLGNSLIPMFYRKSSVVTISDTSKQELVAEGFDADRVFVAKPSFDIDFENLVKNIPEPTRPNYRIVYLGRLKKYKGLEILLQAVAILRSSLPVELLIIGKGDYELQLRRKVGELGLDDCVQFSGFVTKTEKASLLKCCSVFVCCSIDEGGWTIAGLEAMRCGVPLVVTDSQRDLVQEGVTGFIVPSNPEIVAEKIRMTLDGDWKSMSIASSSLSAGISWKNSAMVTLKGLRSAINFSNPSVIREK